MYLKPHFSLAMQLPDVYERSIAKIHLYANFSTQRNLLNKSVILNIKSQKMLNKPQAPQTFSGVVHGITLEEIQSFMVKMGDSACIQCNERNIYDIINSLP